MGESDAVSDCKVGLGDCNAMGIIVRWDSVIVKWDSLIVML